jgi:predicted membrane channel-forming protein YqfA (hemolysin III family)
MKEIARRINFFTASFLGVLGISLVREVIQEDDPADKIDDALFFLLGLLVIWWYKKKGYNLSSSIQSVWLFFIGIIIKVGAIMVEHADKEAVGDDFGILAALVIAFIFVLWMNIQNKKT